MKKLALNIEELAVETFSTGSDDGTAPQRGTVRARSWFSYDWEATCGLCQPTRPCEYPSDVTCWEPSCYGIPCAESYPCSPTDICD